MKRKHCTMMVCAMFCGVLLSYPNSSAFSAPQHAWSPRKDCTGVYGTKSKTKTTEVTLQELFKNTDKYKDKMVRVSGTIQSACKIKGCWMMLTDGKNKMRVRFKGYGFFVPVNSKGYRAEVVGQAKVRTISVKMLQHYAMDAGKPELAKKITKPKRTVAFMAHWVTLSKPKK